MEHGSIGCEVLRLCASWVSGRIEGLFSNSMHLRSERLIITLGSPTLPNHPFTIRIPAFPAGIGRLQEFHLRGRDLILGGYGHIDLSGLEEFVPSRWVGSPASTTRQSACLAGARKEAALGFPSGGLGRLLVDQGDENCFTTTARPLVEHIAEAIKTGQWTAMTEPANGLTGLGPGLTPSGDDFVCGLLAALSFHRASCGPGPAPEFLDALAQAAGARTSVFSAQMLHGAARGLVSEDMTGWLAAVHRGEIDAISHATRRLINFGHTSGIDTLCGLITGLEGMLAASNGNV